MKILFDCFSCSPYYGSDEGIGWMWPYIMRKNHEVWALVRSDRRFDIEKYCSKYNISDMHFIYCDIPEWMNFYYRKKNKNKNGTLDFLFYQFLWQYPAYRAAKKYNSKVKFDIIHHVATNDFRLLGRLYKLNIPYIIGPIGGAQTVPKGIESYVNEHQKNELFRKAINRLSVSLPGYSKALKKANKIYFSNVETFNYLKPYLNDLKKAEIMTEVAIDKDKFKTPSFENDPNDNILFLWAGRMEYRKGLQLLIEVLSELPIEKKWKLVLCGDGSERTKLQKQCVEKKLQDRVIFKGKLSGEDLQKQYEQANVFVFPSLRETTGTVIVEAMSNGLPVICLNLGGGAMIVNENTGFVIPVESREICLEEFKKAMIYCIDHPNKIKEMGMTAYSRISELYTWQRKCGEMEKVYRNILNNKTDIR